MEQALVQEILSGCVAAVFATLTYLVHFYFKSIRDEIRGLHKSTDKIQETLEGLKVSYYNNSIAIADLQMQFYRERAAASNGVENP